MMKIPENADQRTFNKVLEAEIEIAEGLRCPECGSSNPWFTQCLDVEFISLFKSSDAWWLKKKGCSHSWHQEKIKAT